jgi:hypothetical protein
MTWKKHVWSIKSVPKFDTMRTDVAQATCVVISAMDEQEQAL